MLKPVRTAPESPITSPERNIGHRRSIHVTGSHAHGRGQHNGYLQAQHHQQSGSRYDSDRDGFMSEPEGGSRMRAAQQMRYRDMGRVSGGNNNNNIVYKNNNVNNRKQLYLDFSGQGSPPSDSGGIFDSHCFATTPSSSNGGNSDLEGHSMGRGGNKNASPTSQLLMDYEEHLVKLHAFRSEFQDIVHLMLNPFTEKHP